MVAESIPGQACDAGVPSALLLVYDWECGEEHVQCSVDEGGVEGEQENDWLGEEEDPWA